jgi:hypothetical protein
VKLQTNTIGKSPESQAASGWRHRPHYSAPGSFAEQVAAINLFGQLPNRLKTSPQDREIVWQTVRAILMPHTMEANS